MTRRRSRQPRLGFQVISIPLSVLYAAEDFYDDLDGEVSDSGWSVSVPAFRSNAQRATLRTPALLKGMSDLLRMYETGLTHVRH
jgi:hypothetical protein